MKKAAVCALVSVCYGSAAAFSVHGQTGAAALLMAAAAAAGAAGLMHRGRGEWDLLDPAGLYSLFWLGGQAVACLKLSRLSEPWDAVTWLSLYLAWLCFAAVYAAVCALSERRLRGRAERNGGKTESDRPAVSSDDAKLRRLRIAELVLLLAAWTAFVTEAVTLRFIPLFSPEPHAYSYFHLTGIHYFTVSCVLVPPLAVQYLAETARRKALTRRTALEQTAVMAAAFALPILCVSRFQLVFSAGLALLCLLLAGRRVRAGRLAAGAVVLAALYVALTFARHHDVTYLNGIFEMKDAATPIYVTQPYMYIANNYENFHVLVRDLPAHAHGLRQLFPVIAVTGLKFSHPEWAALPLYTTKWELTTLTLVYDAYYDFGVIGVAAFAAALGAACALLQTLRARRGADPAVRLLFAQTAMYLILSFFTTWFSNPTTWFYYGITFLLWLYVSRERKKGDSYERTEV